MKNKTFFKVLYIVALTSWICFIFSNSFIGSEDSAAQSGRVLEWINAFLESINFPVIFSEFFIRKLAHFTEYFILGTLLSGLFLILKKMNISSLLYCGFLACLTAMTDETIQYFTGRGSMLLDVWLDFLSAVLAIFLIYIFYLCRQKHMK